MNGFRTFLASLQFDDDRLARVSVEVVEETTSQTVENHQHQTDEQPLAA